MKTDPLSTVAVPKTQLFTNSVHHLKFTCLQPNNHRRYFATPSMTKRNSNNITSTLNEQTTAISAKTPLAQLKTMSTDLRRITSGHTTFSVEFETYEQISQKEFQELKQKI